MFSIHIRPVEFFFPEQLRNCLNSLFSSLFTLFMSWMLCWTSNHMATLTCSFQACVSSGGHHPCPGDLPRARLPREALPDPAGRREGGGELQWTRRQGRAHRQQVPGRLKHNRGGWMRGFPCQVLKGSAVI